MIFMMPTPENQQEMLDRLQDALRPPVVIFGQSRVPAFIADSLRWEETSGGGTRAVVWPERN